MCLGASILSMSAAKAEMHRIDCGVADVQDTVRRAAPGLSRTQLGEIVKKLCPNGTGRAAWPKSVIWPSSRCFPRGTLESRLDEFIADGLRSSSVPANIRAACERIPEPVAVEPSRSHIGAVEASRLLPGDRLAVSLGADRTLRLWELRSSTAPLLIHTARGAKSATYLAVSPDGRHAVLNDDGDQPTVIALESGRVIARLEASRMFGGPASYIGDGSRLLASASPTEMGVFDASDGRLLRKYPAFRSAPRVAAVSADGRVAAVGTDGEEIRVFLVDTGQPLLVAERPSPSAFAFERDGTRLIIGQREKFEVYDLANGTFGPTLGFAPGSGQRGVGAVFLPQTDRALVCSRDLQEWDLATGRAVRTILSFPFQCTALSLSSDGSTALVSHDDSEMMLVDIPSGRVIRTLGQPGAKSLDLEIPVR
jgi:WD40 repeat protein